MIRLVLLSSLFASTVVAAPVEVDIWTYPVLVALESFAQSKAVNFRGFIWGGLEEKPNRVTVSSYSDVDPDQISEAIENGANCEAATMWICKQRLDSPDNGVTSIITWKRPGVKYCIAKCASLTDMYAFVAKVGTREESE